MSEEKGYKGLWIPAEILFDKRLTAMDKLLLAGLALLDNGEGCFATNGYLARVCGCNETKVSKAVAKLKNIDLITTVFYDGRQRVLKANLAEKPSLPRQNANHTLSKSQPNLGKKPSLPCQNDNLTLSNCQTATSYIKKEDKKSDNKRFAPPTLEEVRAYCRERNNRVDAQRFIDYYTSNGWKVGRNPMKDWKAAVRTWERGDYGGGKRENKGLEWDTRTVFEVMDDDERGL